MSKQVVEARKKEIRKKSLKSNLKTSSKASSKVNPTAGESGEVSGQVDLETLLNRNDVWRGSSQVFVAQQGIDTGFPLLNKVLLHKGWPEASLIESAQTGFFAHWFLLAPAVKTLMQENQGVIVLLNPPGTPYAPGLLKMDLDTDRLVVVTVKSKADFVACFVELSRSSACQIVLAWQPKQRLSYTELRKCQLATSGQAGLYFLFRHQTALNQNSPAALRLLTELEASELMVTLIKQRGAVAGQTVALSLPSTWFGDCAYTDLLIPDSHAATTPWVKAGNIQVLAFDQKLHRRP